MNNSNHADAEAGETIAYAGRPYERRLATNGRKIVSIDLDEDLVRTIDARRGDKRRGLEVDDLIRQALQTEMSEVT